MDGWIAHVCAAFVMLAQVSEISVQELLELQQRLVYTARRYYPSFFSLADVACCLLVRRGTAAAMRHA